MFDVKCNFLLIFSDNDETAHVSEMINNHVKRAHFISIHDATTTSADITENSPHIILAKSAELADENYELARYLVMSEKFKKAAIIFVGNIPEEIVYADEMESGKIQFLENIQDKNKFKRILNNALYFAKSNDDDLVNVKFLSPGDQLITRGKTSKYIYLVKDGSLEASVAKNNDRVVLGTINANEYVGEMAYFNGETHSADVFATSDCEVIEIPIHLIDQVLLKNPDWAKALMRTLTQRMKKVNQSLIQDD